MVVVLMGVAGSGKSTVGRLLAERLGWEFVDGDDFHPPENVAKMRRGEPLTDADRAPWLTTLHGLIEDRLHTGPSAVLACSALREQYRQRLRHGHEAETPLVYLRGDEELLRSRLTARRGHFMKADLLTSQLATLEEPHDALVVDVAASPSTIVERIVADLHLEG